MKQYRLGIFSKWCQRILKIFSIQIQDNIFHEKNNTGAARVIISNHVSYLDVPILASLGPTLFLAKKEVSNWPMMGWLGKCLGMLFVDRTSLASRAQSIIDIQKQVELGNNVVIFPEGTTSESGPQRGRVPYFLGAFRVARTQEVPLEIIYLEYNDLEICSWLGSESFVGHLWKFLGHKKTNVKVRREWLPRVEHREAQREAHHWSRQWMLEGGHGLMSRMRRVY